jgi:hypothetical protein
MTGAGDGTRTNPIGQNKAFLRSNGVKLEPIGVKRVGPLKLENMTAESAPARDEKYLLRLFGNKPTRHLKHWLFLVVALCDPLQC